MLDHVTWPKPQAELIDACFETYRRNHPWVEDEPSPKSILREMLESGETFGGMVQRYKLQRSEGLVLRYLTDAWRTLDRSLTDELGVIDERVIESLCAQLVRVRDLGHEVVVVSSGAVSAGVAALGLPARPTDTPTLQALSAAYAKPPRSTAQVLHPEKI